MWVEGVQVWEEAWGVFGQRGSYRRLVVTCPYHASCQKKRNYDTVDAGPTGLEHDEPLAFLGCWLSKHALYPEGSKHVAYKPARSAVMEYVRAQGWRPELFMAEGP